MEKVEAKRRFEKCKHYDEEHYCDRCDKLMCERCSGQHKCSGPGTCDIRDYAYALLKGEKGRIARYVSNIGNAAAVKTKYAIAIISLLREYCEQAEKNVGYSSLDTLIPIVSILHEQFQKTDFPKGGKSEDFFEARKWEADVDDFITNIGSKSARATTEMISNWEKVKNQFVLKVPPMEAVDNHIEAIRRKLGQEIVYTFKMAAKAQTVSPFIDEVAKEREKLEEECKRLRDEIILKEKQRETIEAEQQKLEASKKKMNDEIQELGKKKTQSNAEVTAISQAVGQENARLYSLEQTIKIEEEKLVALNIAKENLLAEIKKNSDTLEVSRTSNKDEEKRKAAFQIEIKKLNDRIKDLEESISYQQKELSKKTIEVCIKEIETKSVANSIQLRKDELEENKKELESANERLQSLSRDIVKQENAKSSLAKEIKELGTEKEELQREIENLKAAQGNFNALKVQNATAIERVAKLKSLFNSWKDLNDKKKQENKTLTKKQQLLLDSLKVGESFLLSMKTSLQLASKVLEQHHKNAVDAINTKKKAEELTEELNIIIKEQQSKQNRNDDRLRELKTEISKKREEEKKIKEKMETMNTEFKNKKTEKELLDISISTLENKESKGEMHLRKIKNELEKIADETTRIKQNNSKMEAERAEITKKIHDSIQNEKRLVEEEFKLIGRYIAACKEQVILLSQRKGKLMEENESLEMKKKESTKKVTDLDKEIEAKKEVKNNS
eukprot:TRINITY_DN1804_c0_g3_i1.p1 TRINITY_DN1804_c0_g3~~TRINITY_DN1804_c0_g3_i1.p1  ORF type:complete len:731 (-),score=209.57 TRINITY_DN1804_c0_g3_i1:1957-4149(-)